MKLGIFAFCGLVALSGLFTRTYAWEPAAGHTQIPIWSDAIPDAQPIGGPENTKSITDKMAAGEPWTAVNNVSRPTITVYPPKGQNTGAAVVVFPGEGYEVLAIDLEGTEACDWLTFRGITCVLLKYRVPGDALFTGSGLDLRTGPYPSSSVALEDAQRALGLVRFRAAEWHIDPRKIGVLGFSAGGYLAAAVSTHFEHRLYPVADAADQESCRPDFAVIVSPGYLSADDKRFGLNPDIRVAANTPPTFLLHAEDDAVDNVRNSIAYYVALRKAKVPVEIHLYAEGGHAFGLRHSKFQISQWPQLMETWLKTIGIVSIRY